jgi:putative ATPase
MRASKVDDAIGWLAVMLDGGEDPRFIARRLSIFAAEDVGNADPMATLLASATLTAADKLGMPEIRINLAQTTCYLATCQKSTRSYQAINKALEFVRNRPSIPVPPHLTNSPVTTKNEPQNIFPRFY